MKTLVISCLNVGKIHNWVIPQKAQGFILNYYAQIKNLKIGLNVSEELFFNNKSRTIFLDESYIFTSNPIDCS